VIHDDDLEWRIRRRLAEIQAFLGSSECTDEVAARIDRNLEAATDLISELRNPVGEHA
jgi:hypothetical protein